MRAPLDTMYVTNPFLAPGYGVFGKHAGVDLRASVGTNVYAPADGVVTESYVGSNGIQVLSARIDGKEWRFLHLSSRLLAVGNSFTTGQIIAKSGNSGNVLAHLHIDVRKAGTAWNHSINDYYNPLSIINESTQGDVMDTDAKVGNQYYTLRGNTGTSAERKSWIGKSYEEFNSVAKAEVNSRTQNITNLTNAVASLSVERDTARTQVATLTKEVLAERDKVKVLEANNKTLQSELDGAKQAYKELEAQHQTQIAELNKVIEIKDNEIKRLSTELANCDGESLTWSQHLVLGIKGLLSALNPINK